MNKQINQANCFFVPAFQRAIPFQTNSRIIKIIRRAIVPLAYINAGAAAP